MMVSTSFILMITPVVNANSATPAISITLPANGATVTATHPTVTWSASAASGIAYYQIVRDGGNWVRLSSGQTSYTTQYALADGQHTMILVGEAFLFVGDLNSSIIVHLFNILLCVAVPLLLREDILIWQSFSLVSMLRVMNLGMPKFATLTIYWMPLVYGPVILVAFLLLRDESLGWKDYLLKARKFFEVRVTASGWKLWYLPLALVLSLVMRSSIPTPRS